MQTTTILFVNTITAEPNLAIMTDEKSKSLPLPNRRNMSRDIIAVFDKLLSKSRVAKDDLSAIVVFTGPGSYTSIRVGTTFANALGYSLGIPVVGMTLYELQETKLPQAVYAGHDNVYLHSEKGSDALVPLESLRGLEVFGIEIPEYVQKRYPDITWIEPDSQISPMNYVTPELFERIKIGLKTSRFTHVAEPHYVLPANVSASKKERFF